MDELFAKNSHPTKISIICSCCGRPFQINAHDKREPWCSTDCRLRIVRGNKSRPKEKEPTVRELVDAYLSGEEFA